MSDLIPRAQPNPDHETVPLPPGCVEGHAALGGVHGLRLHYVACGNGQLALLLHGFPEFWYSWRHQLPVLGARFHAVAPDLRGYNLSDRPASGYDVATLCDDLRALIESFGERQAIVIGHDWGGVLAWLFALRYPDYVRRLAILNAPHPAAMLREWRRPSQLRRSWYVGLIQLRGLAERALVADDYALVRRMFRAADRQRAWMSDDDLQRYVDALARPGALSAALEYYRQIRPRYLGVLSPMRVITAPTLVLWGERDPALGIELLDGLDRWIRDLTVLRFPAAGHWLNQEEPMRVNAALLRFLS
jgi:pimeloyl-ACP methyl ester carboxylesterase